MKILLFDPSGTDNYCNGLADGINRLEEVHVVARDNYEPIEGRKYDIYRFFCLSKKYVKNKFQKSVKYIIGWLKTLQLVKKEKYDVVHIQWLLSYSVDIIFLKLLRKKVEKIVYTAHNVLPHVEGERQIDKLEKIYNIVDVIIVHGQASKKELMEYFPAIDESRVKIQPHGINPHVELIDNKLLDFQKYFDNLKGKVFLYLGVIFDGKGVDRLFSYWANNYTHHSEDLLVVAGNISELTTRYEEALHRVKGIDNFLYIPRIVSKEEHDYLYNMADIIVLPYRHASMSGVIFDAAMNSKALVTTDVGCIPEYLESGVDSYVIENNDNSFETNLREVFDKEIYEFEHVGKLLHDNIYRKYNWNVISKKLLEEIY